MIALFLISNADGHPFYSRDFGNKIDHIDEAILSGLISAIGLIGKQLFKQEIATISFGTPPEINSYIVIVAKELVSENQKYYFVFFTQGECNHKLIREISTTVLMEIRRLLRDPNPNFNAITAEVNKIIDNKFKSFTFC
jgi:hypothetical protein